MKSLFLISALIFSSNVFANSCLDGKLAAMEKGAGQPIKARTEDPVTGKELNSAQAELATMAKQRIEKAFGRELTSEEALLAKGYSDAYRAGNTVLMGKYEAAMGGRFSPEELKSLQSRITDPTYAGEVKAVVKKQDPPPKKNEYGLSDEQVAERTRLQRNNPYYNSPTQDSTSKYSAFWDRSQSGRGKIETVNALETAAKADGLSPKVGGAAGQFGIAVDALENMAKKVSKDLKNADEILASELLKGENMDRSFASLMKDKKETIEATRRQLAEKCEALKEALSRMSTREKSASGKGEMVVHPERAAAISALLGGC